MIPYEAFSFEGVQLGSVGRHPRGEREGLLQIQLSQKRGIKQLDPLHTQCYVDVESMNIGFQGVFKVSTEFGAGERCKKFGA